MPAIPTILELIHIFQNEDNCLQFLLHCEIFYSIEACPNCGSNVTLVNKSYRCTNTICRKRISLYEGTIFSKSKLKCNEVMHIAYLWLAGCNNSTILNLIGHSTITITNFIALFRQLVTTSLDADDTIIGGEGIVVEIDESKFGKRKYNRGRRVEGVWIIGGVERTAQRLMFAEVVERRDAATLMEVISRHVAPGSIVHTDLWRGYTDISEVLDVEHRTVNHSLHFVNPVDGTHTNTIEGTWNGMKIKISSRKRSREGMEEHLFEFIWRRKHKDDLWGGFIQSLKTVHIIN
jgi:ISXO2-like transposase domain